MAGSRACRFSATILKVAVILQGGASEIQLSYSEHHPSGDQQRPRTQVTRDSGTGWISSVTFDQEVESLLALRAVVRVHRHEAWRTG